MRICPATPECLHRVFLKPFLEGAERLNRAWQGVAFHEMKASALSLKDRVVSFLVGTALLVPLFINNLIWIFWRALGSPKLLSDDYIPQTNPPKPPSIIPLSPVTTPLTPRTEIREYREDWSTDQQIDVRYTIKRDESLMTCVQKSEKYESTAIYGRDEKITSYWRKSKGKTLTVKPVEGGLDATLEGGGPTIKKEFRFKGQWIQQPTLGLKNFLASDEPTLEFYSVLPENPVSSWFGEPLLLKAKATKKEIEQVDGMGPLLKVVVTLSELPYSGAKAGEMWFEPKTFLLKKYIEPCKPGPTKPKGGVLLQQSLSPEPARL